MDDKEYKATIEYLLKCLETQGAAASTVKDGHVLLFKRSYLQSLLDKNPDNKNVIMFIKRPDFKN